MASKFEHLRHLPPLELATPREVIIVLAPMRSNVNLSRIVRLAGCAGIRKLIQCGPGTIDKTIARDALDYVDVTKKGSLVPVLKSLGLDGYHRVGLEQTTHSTRLAEFQFVRRTALVIGNERTGLDQDALDQLDAVVEIPVYGQPHSYNAATATTMAVYEFIRQFPNG
jgi:tRNA G18 (ribose-2'-O)-methylase SpoU